MGIGAEFWRLCPFELKTRAAAWARQQRSEQDGRMAAAWHGALWARVEKRHFPRLAEVLSEESRGPPPGEAQQVRALFAGMRLKVVYRKRGQDGAAGGATEDPRAG